MEKQETTYISKLIPKDLLPLLLQQLWWKGFDEAQKKFPNEDASNVAVRRLIKRMFTEIDVDATRKQIEEIIQSVANEYFKAGMSNYCMSFNRETFDVEIPRLPISQFVDRVLALLGGTTNGK